MNKMADITQYFTQLIEQSRSLDIAEAEFKRCIADDEELRAEYREWCASIGTTERYGFREYCEEYMESQEDIWNSLRDYDEQDE